MEDTTKTQQERTYERHDVEDTPYSAIKIIPDGVVKIAIGNNLISEKEFKCVEEVQKYLQGIPWDVITNSMALICENILTIHKQTKENHD